MSLIDNILHVAGGALLAVPLVLDHSPTSTFLVFSIWGLLREQAQRHDRTASWRNNWLHIWSWKKLVEGLAWGIGGGIAHIALWIY